MTERQYRPPQTAALDKLIEAYERIEKTAVWADARDERVEPDPESTDPWHHAKEMAERYVKLMVIIGMTFGAKPKDMIYAMELASLNILNARDCPLPSDLILKIRKAAYAYYAESLPKVPEPGGP